MIVLRRLGDVLLTTPLIRSLRRAWPDATIDALVFADTAGILGGNPDLDWRRHDAGAADGGAEPRAGTAAVAPLRPCGFDPMWRSAGFFAFVAGRVRVGPIEDNLNGRFKRFAYSRSLSYAPGVHRVEEILRLVDAARHSARAGTGLSVGAGA